MTGSGKLEFALRSASLLALALALADPPVPFGPKPTNILLLDRSGSMQLVEREPEPVLRRLRPFETVPFGDSRQTNIARALAETLSSAGADQTLFLYSDGIETQGDAGPLLALAKRKGHPVYLIRPDDARLPHARLEDVRLPRVVRERSTFTAQLRVFSSRSGYAEVEVTDENGSTVTGRTVKLVEGFSTHEVDLTSGRAGPMRLTFHLGTGFDTEDQDNRIIEVVTVTGSTEVLYVSAGAKPALATALDAAGFNLQRIAPARLAQEIPETVGVIVLDNVMISDAPGAAWTQLARAVEQRGAGLVVLGGDAAFGPGGYRGSTLESLLPVTAEAASPIDPAATLFLLDRSGSMDSTPGGINRFDYARAALVQSAGSLALDDLGLIVFDATARVLLPLAARTDPAAAIAAALATELPSGGTRLSNGLRLAVAQLAESDRTQKLLIIVTDGFVEERVPTEMIEQHGIDVIAIAVGADANLESLRTLTDRDDSVLLRIDDVMELPAVVSRAIGKRRLVFESGRGRPRRLRPLPPAMSRVNGEDWPAVRGYAVTRSRSSADTYLVAPRGDPLLAAWQVGVATVVALPAGLGSFTPDWLAWAEWPALTGGLISWAAGSARSNLARLAITRARDGFGIAVDTLGKGGDWDLSGPSSLTAVVSPPVRLFDIPRIAPGRYAGHLPLPDTGPYRLSINVAGSELRRDLFFTASDEWNIHDSRLGEWLGSGLLRDANAFEPIAATPRYFWLVTALSFYLVSLIPIFFRNRTRS